MKIILATQNKDKFEEIKSALADLNIEILSLNNFPLIGDIVEDGETLQENALIKARAVFDLTGIPVISDDTGLCVKALNGDPGVYSARYAGENATYCDNVEKLIKEMSRVSLNNRLAQFKTVIVYKDKYTELIANGVVKGEIAFKPKGVGGFGYDPVFYVPNEQKTFAEMTMKEKNKISHRGLAINNLKKILHSYFKDSPIKESA